MVKEWKRETEREEYVMCSRGREPETKASYTHSRAAMRGTTLNNQTCTHNTTVNKANRQTGKVECHIKQAVPERNHETSSCNSNKCQPVSERHPPIPAGWG